MEISIKKIIEENGESTLIKNQQNRVIIPYKTFEFRSRIFYTGEVIEPAHSCRYLRVPIDSNQNFENHLNSDISKMEIEF